MLRLSEIGLKRFALRFKYIDKFIEKIHILKNDFFLNNSYEHAYHIIRICIKKMCVWFRRNKEPALFSLNFKFFCYMPTSIYRDKNNLCNEFFQVLNL